MSTFESLPVELIADILGELDLTSLVLVAYLSRRLKDIASDPSLNPWRRPILRALRAPTSVDNEAEYEPVLRQLSVRQIVPRHNWVEILSLGKPEYLLFEMTLPNLKETEWEECFRRRFLPGWVKWKTTSWKAAFLKILHRTWHRSHSSCTADEGWTKYILLNRNGSANLLEASSRSYGPMAVFHEIKLQTTWHTCRPTFDKPRSSFSVNQNARAFLHPPGVTKGEDEGASSSARSISEGSDESFAPPAADPGLPGRGPATPFMLRDAYRPLIHPLPSSCHANYPLYTSGGEDKRWMGNGEMEENGRQWVGPMLITAQLVGPQTKQQPADIFLPLQDLDLIAGPGRNQYASLTWEDLTAVAPWLELTNMINGAGLGH